jgi:hypothetical protein
MVTGHEFLSKSLKGKDHLGDCDIDGRIILKWTLEKLDTILEKIQLNFDTVQKQAFVNMVMNLQVP